MGWTSEKILGEEGKRERKMEEGVCVTERVCGREGGYTVHTAPHRKGADQSSLDELSAPVRCVAVRRNFSPRRDWWPLSIGSDSHRRATEVKTSLHEGTGGPRVLGVVLTTTHLRKTSLHEGIGGHGVLDVVLTAAPPRNILSNILKSPDRSMASVQLNKMQKILPVVIVLIAVIVSVSKASLTSKIVKENKEHPGKCYDTSTKKAYVVDSTWTDEGCTRSSCSIGREKGTYEIFRAGCVPVEDQEGCTIISDSQMPFPECCPKVICDVCCLAVCMVPSRSTREQLVIPNDVMIYMTHIPRYFSITLRMLQEGTTNRTIWDKVTPVDVDSVFHQTMLVTTILSLLAIVAEWSQAGRIAWYHTEWNRACASGYVGAKRDG
uniref:Single domain-containing protein n=1 Tax=Timema douglasi TaxID=61478 RepID=A0A7R8VTE5_TIMDO|nr:unnamed protein product [Timema douglasi]